MNANIGKAGRTLPPEKANYTDGESGRKVTIWTSQCTGHNLGFYYHQNPFDLQRNLVYFISNRSGSWQLWRADMKNGRLMQVTDIPGLRNLHHAYISLRNGSIYLSGGGRLYIIDPDTFDCRVLWDPQIDENEPSRRYHRQNYAFPSCDDRWVYFLTRYASEDELSTADEFMKASYFARIKEGLRGPGMVSGLFIVPGMLESPLEMTILRVEVDTGKVEEIWRGHSALQHPMSSPTDPDISTCIFSALMRPNPTKYCLLRAGHPPQPLLGDEMNTVHFHDFWHPNGKSWLVHRCENLEPIPEIYAPIPGKMRFYVREVDIAGFLATGEVQYRDWYESAGEAHVHLHMNIAPDGSFLVGDGQPDCPYICRLDWKDDGTIPATPLCRAGYPGGGVDGMECNPNVHVSPDNKWCFFTTHIDGEAQLGSVETGV